MKKFISYSVLALLFGFGFVYQMDLFSIQAITAGYLSALPFGDLFVHHGGNLVMCAAVAPFPVDAELTAVSVAYKNGKFIADDIFPRVPVGKQEFKYRKYALADSFRIPDTKVGRTGAPPQIQFGFTTEPSMTQDYGLDDPIPESDINNAPAGYDPKAHAARSLTNLVLLDREKRAADLCFNTNSYGAANKITLAGNDQLSDFTNSKPIQVIMDALASMIMRGNLLVFGRAVWNKFSQHPVIVKAVNGNSGDSGVARRQQVKELFEVDDILIGEGLYSSAKKGQAAVMVPLWGKMIACLYRDTLANTESGTTYGLTAQWGSRVSGSIPDPDIGLRGGVRVRVGESVKELVTANDLGYLILDAIA